jgi:2-iminobutanoate/2-iminopropanoate deaminase
LSGAVGTISNVNTSLRPLLFALIATTSLPAAELPTTDSVPPPILKTDKFKLGDWEDEIGYRQAVRVGNVLYISGSVGAGDMPKSIRSAYGTLRKTLAHYGLTFQNVVKENLYTTDISALEANLSVRREFYGKDFPAATWVQVQRLYDATDVIEVEVIAVFPN